MRETILQFGTGRFIRGFFDRFVQNAADAGADVGKIVVVRSTSGDAPPDFSRGYRVRVRGVAGGETIDRVENVRSISRVLAASENRDALFDVAASAHLRLIVSNTTEAGFALDAADTSDAGMPRSFPAKLAALLEHRRQAGLPGVTILPFELLDDNGARLRELVLKQARLWNYPEAFSEWVSGECVWLDSLVDCIVTLPVETFEGDDEATVQAEPYALLAIRGSGPRPEIPDHPAIRYVDDLPPIYLRKVRILNGLHTAMVALWLGSGKTTVGEVMNDPACAAELDRLLDTEILPVLEGRVPDARAFADAVLDRFRNPFVNHRLADIAKGHDAKKEVRLRTTFDEYVSRFGSRPPILDRALSRNPVSPSSYP